MLAHLAAVDVDDRAGLGLPASSLAQDVAVVAARHEADLLAVALLGRGQPQRARQLPNLRLGHLTERETCVRQLLLAKAVEEVALVLVAVAAAQQPESLPAPRPGRRRAHSGRWPPHRTRT